MQPIKPHEAIACYLMSRRQGVEMIAYITGKSATDVKRHIQEGERLLKEQEKARRDQ
jgi:hypothetical protein